VPEEAGAWPSVRGVERNRLLIATGAGASYGATASALNDLSSAYGWLGGALAGTQLQSVFRVLSTLMGAGWAWAAFAVAVGWYVRTRRWGAAAGAFALPAATTAYYALDSFLRAVPIWGSDIFWWTAVGLLVGPPLGMVGAYIRRPGVPGLLAALAVPVGAAAQMMVLPQGLGGPHVASEAVWARWLVGVTAVLVSAWVVVRRRSVRPTSTGSRHKR
jgi:hypothetical protein